MGRARVSISVVTRFRQSVEEEQTSISHLKNSTDCIDTLIQQAQKELRKIEKCQTRCSNALGIGEKKLSELEKELSQLMQELAVTPSTITVTVACGTDEEGNTIYESSEERNPEYDALLNQIDTVETKIQVLESLLSELGEKIRELDRTSNTFENAIHEFTTGKNELQDVCRSQERRSEHAVEQLQRAITCIRKYLDEKVSLNPVPHHTSISWFTNSSATSLSGNQTRGLSTSNKSNYVRTTLEWDTFTYTDTRGNKVETPMSRYVYQRIDIDLDRVCSDGETNREKMREGKSPRITYSEVQPDGTITEVETIIELHHLTQRERLTNPEAAMTNGTLVEMPAVVHKKHDKPLHMQYPVVDGVRTSFRVDKNIDEPGNHEYRQSDDDKMYNKFRDIYWKKRLDELEKAEKQN